MNFKDCSEISNRVRAPFCGICCFGNTKTTFQFLAKFSSADNTNGTYSNVFQSSNHDLKAVSNFFPFDSLKIDKLFVDNLDQGIWE